MGGPLPLHLSPKNVVIWPPTALSAWPFSGLLGQGAWAFSGLQGILGMCLCLPNRQLSKLDRTLISLLTEGETEAQKGQGLA